MSSSISSSLQSFPSSNESNVYNPYTSGGSNSIVALALGSAAGLTLLGGFVAAVFIGRRVWRSRDGDNLESWRSWRGRSYQLEGEEKEKPEMDEIQMDEEDTYKDLGKLSEEVMPLSFTLLSPPNQIKTSSPQGIVSLLIRLPSPQQNHQQQHFSTSSRASSELAKNEALPDFVLGSDLVVLEGGEKEKWDLLEMRKR